MKPGKREERTTSKRAPLDAARTQEIGAADILEDNPIEVDIPIDVEADVPEDDADSSSVSGRSISPLALSVAPPEPGPRTADATYKITAMRPRRRLGMVVVGVMGLSACILLGAAVRAGSGNDEAAQTAATSVSMSSGLPPVRKPPIRRRRPAPSCRAAPRSSSTARSSPHPPPWWRAATTWCAPAARRRRISSSPAAAR